MDSKIPVAYLDTCILSGLAKGDLKIQENAAMSDLLRLQKENKLKFVTSEHARDELSQSPVDKNRVDHIIYNLISGTPLAAPTHAGMLTLLGVGGGPRENPLFSELKALLPDLGDAKHLFQAKSSNVDYFLTADERTILHNRKILQERYGITVILPSELLVQIQQ